MSTCPVMQKRDDSILRNTSCSTSNEINSRENYIEAHFQRHQWKYFGGYCAVEEPADLHVRITVKLKGPAPHDRDKTTKPRAPPSLINENSKRTGTDGHHGGRRLVQEEVFLEGNLNKDPHCLQLRSYLCPQGKGHHPHPCPSAGRH